jgi:hypothetical protein
MIPKIERTGGVFRFHWDWWRLHITLSRIREGRDDHLHGELLATTDAPGYHPHLVLTRVNLTSDQSRSNLAKRLQKEYPEADWDLVLEQVAVHTLRMLREGNPAEAVTGYESVDPPSYLLAPLIRKNEPTVIFGEGGIGKSYLALFLGMMVQWGKDLLSFRAQRANVLYLDWETSRDLTVHRVCRLRRGHPAFREEPESHLLYRRCDLPFHEELETIQNEVMKSRIGLVIVDSAGPALAGDLNDAGEVNRFFNALRTLNASALVITHVAKEPGNEKTPIGSVYFLNRARIAFEIRKHQEPEENQIVLGLLHRKDNEGRLIRPIGLRMIFSDEEESIVFEKASLLETPLESHLPLRERIQHCLRSGAKTAAEIASELSCPEDSVRRILNRWKGRLFVQVAGHGQKWGLQAVTPP